ncbi:MAG TPA: helix-hairpin-helix domain-containing protein [Thermoanaerobaculia bacterium]|jgi:DNA uptake protein ComE-like DNA-binding protein|nr:helix-hairpin-helix domain-containing protein [Thermoanaerobaculia bacterium]
MTASRNSIWRHAIVLVAALALAWPVLSPAPAHAAGAAGAAASAAGPVDLNTASEKDLTSLPGVGAATAKKIIAGRPYAAVGDLARAGVSAKTIAKITPLVTVSGGGAPAAGAKAATSAAPPAATGTMAAQAPKSKAAAAGAGAKTAATAGPVDLNTASDADLVALPGVGAATAKKIVAGRPYASVADLARAGVPAKTIAKITPLVTVSGNAAPAAGTKAAAAAAPATSAAAPGTMASQAPRSKAAAAPAAAATTAPPPATAAGGTAPAPPQPGMVWVNLKTKVYHVQGDEWYGKTKHGQYMTEADAIKAGYRAAKNAPKAPPK